MMEPTRTGPTAMNFGAVGPDPAAAATVLAAWSYQPAPGFSDLLNMNYTVNLTGAGFQQLPAPGAGAMLAMGVLRGLQCHQCMQ